MSIGEDLQRDTISEEASVRVTGAKFRKAEEGEGGGTAGKIKVQVTEAIWVQMFKILLQK